MALVKGECTAKISLLQSPRKPIFEAQSKPEVWETMLIRCRESGHPPTYFQVKVTVPDSHVYSEKEKRLGAWQKRSMKLPGSD